MPLEHTTAGPADRPTEREMERARRVQFHLLPRRAAQLMTLEYAGLTRPAAGIGGDVYDFLRPSPRRLVVVIGDASGHGVPAALMIAGLQATLRSHYALTASDLRARLESINRLFVECTATGHFATLFLGEYDDRTRVLRYANCGHVPPMLLRADGVVERLQPTAGILGVFTDWQCGIAEVQLAPGDLLLACSDGATEARDAAGEEYGEARLAGALRAMRHEALDDVLHGLAEDIRRFTGTPPADDLTLVAARALVPDPTARLSADPRCTRRGAPNRRESDADLHPSG